jgi:hypothetical protein
MIRRLLSACVGAALVGLLSLPADGIAKPPGLPEDPEITVKGPIAPPAEPLYPETHLPQPETTSADSVFADIKIEVNEANTGPLIFGVGVDSNSGLNGNIVEGARKEQLPAAKSLYPSMSPMLSIPVLYKLRPTARRTLADSLLFGVHPALALLPTDTILDSPCDHPQPAEDDRMFHDMPKSVVATVNSLHGGIVIENVDWLKWVIRLSHLRYLFPEPEENEGYVQPLATGVDFAYRAVRDMPCSDRSPEVTRFFGGNQAPVPFNCGDEVTEVGGPDASETESPAPTIEILPMPDEDSDITCPYLRQQMIDRHACQIADPEIGRDVLANLECLKEADNLLEMAKELARYGFLTEAMMCCDLAANRCPGSPCAARAVDTLNELAISIIRPTTDTEESAEGDKDEPTAPPTQENPLWLQLFESMGLSQTWSGGMVLPKPNNVRDSADIEPGVEPMVFDLMKVCHLLMSQGMQHQAAELARQAYALDPQRVSADPLVYKMHLLAESSPTPAGASKESEPPTCPYCPSIGKPIREIVPEKKKSKDSPTTFFVPSLPPIDYEVVPALDGELLLSAECSLGDNVYHLRYKHGSLTVWTTTDASKAKP